MAGQLNRIGGAIMPGNQPDKRLPVVQPEDQSIKLIPLTRGMVAVVDASDYEWLSKFYWIAHKSGRTYYACRGKQQIPMHREIIGAAVGELVDHADGDGLNNRRSNLRSASKAQNQRNAPPPRRNTSGYKGVRRGSAAGMWMADITANYKKNHIGTFKTRENAATAYNIVALQLHGDFAWINK